MDELVAIAREAIPYISVDTYGLYMSRTTELRAEAATYLEEIIEHRYDILEETFARSVSGVLSLAVALTRYPALDDLLSEAERIRSGLGDETELYEAQRAVLDLLERRLDAPRPPPAVLESSDSESDEEDYDWSAPMRPPRRPLLPPARGYRTT